MTAIPLHKPVFDDARDGVRRRILDYARARCIGLGQPPARAMARGRFADHPGADRPTLMGTVDFAYAFHVTGLLDELSNPDDRRRWIELVLSFQGEDGWFRARDRQTHGVEHATAYALGALQILAGSRTRADGLAVAPLTDLRGQLAPQPSARQAPFAVGLLDRIHFWRGSHRVGGIAAIVGAVRDLRLDSARLLGLDDPDAWLRGWAGNVLARVSPADGMWHEAPAALQMAFDAAYRLRHDPGHARIGGAAHLYWIISRLGIPYPHPRPLIDAVAPRVGPGGLCERHPYCLDFDAAFLLARAADHLDAADPAAERARRTLERSRRAVLAWLEERAPERWPAGSHFLPGALAAVAEADRALPPADARGWTDAFETVWWL